MFFQRKMSIMLGKRIKKLRKEKGLSLDQLAVMTDTAKSYLWSLENKEGQNPSSDKIIKLAEALDVTIDYLLSATEEPPKNILQDAFFRKFDELQDEDQKKIELIVDAWRKNNAGV